MVTMTFNGLNLFEEYGVLVNQHATFLPPVRRRQMEVDGRDGVVEFGNNTFGLRTLWVECMLVDPSVAPKVRQLAGLLSQRGRITFSDEPDLAYIGRIYDGSELLRIGGKIRKFDLSFECEPFLIGAVKTLAGDDNVQIDYQGTARTPIRITITNTGVTPINGIVITHAIVS